MERRELLKSVIQGMDFDVLAVQEVNWTCDDGKGQMNYLLDLDGENKEKYKEFRIKFITI